MTQTEHDPGLNPPGDGTKDIGTPPVSGLDMAPTIEWYSTNILELSTRLPRPIDEPSLFKLQDLFYSSLSITRVNALVNLFPEAALARSRLKSGAIIGKPTLYFGKDSLPGHQTTTSDRNEALSPTAIIPAFTDNGRWAELSSDVVLFAIPNEVDPYVREVIHAEALIHEIAHTFISQALYDPEYELRLPNGHVVNGRNFLIYEFGAKEEKYPPISHYASFFRKEGEEFAGEEIYTQIDEELAEVITAWLLGFAFSDRPEARLDPFADRPDVAEIVDAFLNAEEVTT